MPAPDSVTPLPLRLLILGGGAVVSELYLPALERMGWTRGITVTDMSAKVLAQVEAQRPWVQTQRAGFQELLAQAGLRQQFDAVVVALPNSLHVPAVEAALNAGFPVLCEKPLAMSREECESLAALAESKNLVLAVGMVRRLSQAAQTIREALNQQLIGPLREVRIANGGPYGWTSASGAFFKRENGGILADLGVHHLDWLGSLLGSLTPVSYEDDARGGVEASCTYALTSASGVQVSLNLTHLYPRANTTTFVGDKGSLVLGKDDFAACRWYDKEGKLCGELRRNNAFDDPTWPPDFLTCFAQQFANFARSLQGDSAGHVSAREAAATMALIRHAYNVRDESQVSEALAGSPALPQGRTVVTGGTGFVGTALVERLAMLGFKDIIVPVRGYQTCVSAARYPVQLPSVDLTNQEAVRELVKGARWVFHLAFGKSAAEAKTITIEGTKMLVEEAERAGVEAVVILSTTWVYSGTTDQQGIDESARYSPQGGHYGESKAAMQRWCLERAKQMSGTRLIVINPACVYGPGGTTYARLPSELAEAGTFAWVEEGRGIGSYVFIDNLLDAMLHVAVTKEAHGKSFIASDGWTSWREFLSPLLGIKPESCASYAVAELERMDQSQGIALMEVLRSLIQVPALRRWVRERWLVQQLRPLLPRRLLAAKPQPSTSPATSTAHAPSPATWLREIFGVNTARYRNQRLMALGWKPRVDLTEGHRLTLEWLRSNYPKFPKS